ncbi:MAG TPA: hypothetical protein VNQ74_00175 [Burkholderiaceae bacterium]|nr:hypothetical protein [Burkholderiaceae bacterium]
MHQATAVATLLDVRGIIVMRSTVRAEAKAIVALVRTAGPCVVFEEGTQGREERSSDPDSFDRRRRSKPLGRPPKPGRQRLGINILATPDGDG